MAKKKKKPLEPLEAIKRLLILDLLKKGATSQEIGDLIEIDSSSIRHMIPIKKIKKKEVI